MENSRLLIIDDEAVIRDGLKRVLESESFAVETCSSGFHALEIMQQGGLDLIITDLKMPGMSGIEVLKSVRILQPDIPVILITGYASIDTAVDAMKNGASDYISKPFTPDQLLEKVRIALSQRIIILDDMGLGKEVALQHGFHLI